MYKANIVLASFLGIFATLLILSNVQGIVASELPQTAPQTAPQTMPQTTPTVTPTPSPVKQNVQIRGYVWKDINNDGAYQTGEEFSSVLNFTAVLTLSDASTKSITFGAQTVYNFMTNVYGQSKVTVAVPAGYQVAKAGAYNKFTQTTVNGQPMAVATFNVADPGTGPVGLVEIPLAFTPVVATPTPTPVNHNPVIYTTSFVLNQQNNWKSTFIAYDVDSKQTLSVKLVSGALPGAVYKGCVNSKILYKGDLVALITCAFDASKVKAGTYTTQVMVTDSKGGTTTAAVKVTVANPAFVSASPKITSINPTTVNWTTSRYGNLVITGTGFNSGTTFGASTVYRTVYFTDYRGVTRSIKNLSTGGEIKYASWSDTSISTGTFYNGQLADIRGRDTTGALRPVQVYVEVYDYNSAGRRVLGTSNKVYVTFR